MSEVKTRRRTTKAAWVGLAIIVGLIALAAWSLLVPHQYETTGPINLASAKKHSPIELPASARNIQIATYSHWIQNVAYVRFEAPVSDCEAHARLLIPGARVKPLTAEYADIPHFFPPSTTRDLTWFDIRNIITGTMFNEAGPSQAVIYIDRDRGVFYYQMTD